MSIRAEIDGKEVELRDIEPTIREIDQLVTKILAIVPDPASATPAGVGARLSELMRINDALQDRVLAVHEWNKAADAAFAHDMHRFATEWKRSRS